MIKYHLKDIYFSMLCYHVTSFIYVYYYKLVILLKFPCDVL